MVNKMEEINGKKPLQRNSKQRKSGSCMLLTVGPKQNFVNGKQNREKML